MRIFTLLIFIAFSPSVLFAQRRARRIAPATDSAVIAIPETLQEKATSPRADLMKHKKKPPSQPVVTTKKTVIAEKSSLPKSKRLYTAKTTTVYHQLGDDMITIRISQYGTAKDPFFINVHDDEITAVSGAKKMLEGIGGVLIRIENNGQRNIRFKLDKKSYTFDPNRIFSRAGIIQTLNMFGAPDMKSIGEIEKFAARILQLLPASPSCIIALHNNSDGKFSITSYMAGRERERDAKAVSARAAQDPDDLFLTTDSTLFFKLRNEKYNIVLQDNKNAYKDGSLSIYCGERRISYLNCETEHGKLSQYWNMISSAMKLLKKSSADTDASRSKAITLQESQTPGRVRENAGGAY